uniref:Gamma-aminobutyric acid receptor subunit beta n=1 Tax=Culicoides sonorensis TaxID=179676 RepID=A0A336MTR4_CULSO
MYVLSISSLSEVKMVQILTMTTCGCGSHNVRAIDQLTVRSSNGPPVEVGVTMYVLSISSVSEVLMDFTLDFYFRQFWTDPRLAFRKRPGVETLSVGSEFIKNIWVPDTFFVNEKQSYFHIATTSNEFIRIHHSGSITRSIRLTITASCPMNLQYFPMDRQLCHIEIESCKYTLMIIVKFFKNQH